MGFEKYGLIAIGCIANGTVNISAPPASSESVRSAYISRRVLIEEYKFVICYQEGSQTFRSGCVTLWEFKMASNCIYPAGLYGCNSRGKVLSKPVFGMLAVSAWFMWCRALSIGAINISPAVEIISIIQLSFLHAVDMVMWIKTYLEYQD